MGAESSLNPRSIRAFFEARSVTELVDLVKL